MRHEQKKIKIKVLQICAIDETVKSLLLPLIDRLSDEGYDVFTCCSEGKVSEQLKHKGYSIYNINIDRSIKPFSNLKSVYQMWRIMRKERFDIVHVHTPVAALLGRIAAKLAGVKIIIYTAHGFYFHEGMSKHKYRFFVNLEKFAGKLLTSYIFTQSHEDEIAAINENIISKDYICTIGNGVDTKNKFNPCNIDKSIILKKRNELGINDCDRVVTFVGRLVREKGIVELLEAFNYLNLNNCKLLLIGDVFSAERDTDTYEYVKKAVEGNANIIATGRRYDINELLYMSDVFVLPSYREGMPRSIIEAMAMGKPVIATNIRGCREEVLDGETGFIVEVKNYKQLRDRLVNILENPELREEMGKKARLRAEMLFDEYKVLDMEVNIISKLLKEKRV